MFYCMHRISGMQSVSTSLQQGKQGYAKIVLVSRFDDSYQHADENNNIPINIENISLLLNQPPLYCAVDGCHVV